MLRWSVCLLLFVATLGVHGHGVHSSLTTIDYLSQTQDIQITTVLVAYDLEQMLRARTGQQIEIDRTPQAEKLIFESMKKWLELRDAKGSAIPLKWVGMEVRALYVAIYLEGKAPLINGARIRNRAFLETLPDQVNQVIIRKDMRGKTSDHQFKVGDDAWSPIRWE